MHSEKQGYTLGSRQVKLVSISTKQGRIFLLVKVGESNE